MPESVLVFAEHQEGKLSRPTWEAMAAGQNLAAGPNGFGNYQLAALANVRRHEV